MHRSRTVYVPTARPVSVFHPRPSRTAQRQILAVARGAARAGLAQTREGVEA